MIKHLLFIISLACSLRVVAQTEHMGSVRFDVVSIKENTSGAELGYLEVPPNGDRLIVRNTPMFRVIGFAFNKRRNDLIEGLPDWTREERWDIEAVVAPESLTNFHKMSFDQQSRLLQQILATRCALVAHEGKKEVPVYALTIAKSGLKMKEVPAPSPETESKSSAASIGWDLQQSRGQIHARAIPIEGLIYSLSKAGLSRPVVDRTGLKGRYNIDLTFTPEDALGDAAEDNGSAGAPPSIFAGLQEELGLKLEPSRAAVDAVFVSHVSRPSSN